MSQEEFETKRLRVQHWDRCLSDSGQRLKLIDELRVVLTPAVLHHLPEPLHISAKPDAVENWIKERAAESDVMTIRDKVDFTLLGLLILAEVSQQDEPTIIHLGYLIAEPVWGKGYGTELISGLIDWYKGKSVQLIGGVEIENIASSRVLQKNGFQRVEELSTDLTDMFGLMV